MWAYGTENTVILCHSYHFAFLLPFACMYNDGLKREKGTRETQRQVYYIHSSDAAFHFCSKNANKRKFANRETTKTMIMTRPIIKQSHVDEHVKRHIVLRFVMIMF